MRWFTGPGATVPGALHLFFCSDIGLFFAVTNSIDTVSINLIFK